MADKLIQMATQIADFFRHQPDKPAHQAVAEHINHYWTYQMRRDFLAAVAGGAAPDAVVREAAAHVTVPADPA